MKTLTLDKLHNDINILWRIDCLKKLDDVGVVESTQNAYLSDSLLPASIIVELGSIVLFDCDPFACLSFKAFSNDSVGTDPDLLTKSVGVDIRAVESCKFSNFDSGFGANFVDTLQVHVCFFVNVPVFPELFCERTLFAAGVITSSCLNSLVLELSADTTFSETGKNCSHRVWVMRFSGCFQSSFCLEEVFRGFALYIWNECVCNWDQDVLGISNFAFAL